MPSACDRWYQRDDVSFWFDLLNGAFVSRLVNRSVRLGARWRAGRAPEGRSQGLIFSSYSPHQFFGLTVPHFRFLEFFRFGEFCDRGISGERYRGAKIPKLLHAQI